MINTKDIIIDYFKSGIKSTKDFKIGIEHEKFLFNNQNNRRIDYKNQKNAQKEIVFSDYPDEVDKGEFVTFSSGKRMAKWYNEASGNGHLRSKTFPGIAKAMADQWG